MPITVPTTPPLSAYLMQRVEWISSFSDFAAADGWAVVLSLTGPSKGDGFDVSGSDAGAGEWTFLFETDQMCAGSWPWQIWASHATSGRHLLKKGAFTMLPGFFEGAQDGDSSTHVSRMLELITARLEDRLTLDSENYTIGDRKSVV